MKALVSMSPDDDGHPTEYQTATEAATGIAAELIAQGKSPESDITLAIPLPDGRIAIIRIPLSRVAELDGLVKRWEKGYE